MPLRSPMRGRLLAAGIAGGGLLLTHLTSFWLVAPHAHERSELLRETGHAWWPYGVALAVAGLVAALASLAAQGVRGDAVQRGPRETYRYLVPRLVALQALGFLAVEAAERLLIGEGLARLVLEPVVLVGLVVQVAVALVVAAVVALFVFVVRAVAVLLRRGVMPPARPLPRGFLRFSRPRSAVAGLGWAARAPPFTG